MPQPSIVVSCLCPLSADFSKLLLETDFFVGFIEPRATPDLAEPDMSLQAVRIARHVWTFQVENNAITLWDLYTVLLNSGLLPARSFALEVGSLFFYFASSTRSENAQWDFVRILDRLTEILSIIPTGEAIKPMSKTAGKLIELRQCPPDLVARHRFFDQVMSQIGAPPVDRKPRDRVELARLILDIVRSVCADVRLDLLRDISPAVYAFLVTECSAETAAMGLILATLRVAKEESAVTEWCELIQIVDETWNVSTFCVPYSIEVPWLLFCQALLLQMAPMPCPYSSNSG